MADERVVRLLKAIPLFSDLEDDELMDVLRMATPVELEPGREICREGDAGDCMFVIQSGEATVTLRGENGAAVPVATLKTGALIGEMALVDSDHRSADVVAATQVRMFRIDRVQFDQLRSELHPAVFKILRRIGLTVCERLRKVNETVSRVVGAEAPESRQRATSQVRTRGARPQVQEESGGFWGGLMSKIRGG